MKKGTGFLVQGALIGALYAAITLALSAVSFKSLQLRVAEAMIMTVCFTPAAIPGLTIGCIIGNITSPFGLIDVVLGACVTLAASVSGYFTRKIKIAGIPVLTPLGTVLLNALYVGLLDSAVSGGSAIFIMSFASVAISEALVCYGLGIPLFIILKRIGPDIGK